MDKIMIPVLIIPVLNRYDLLDQALESIDYPIDEIIIVNNGKEKYESKLKHLNVRVLNLPSNLGVSGSWNLGIKLYPHVPYWIFSSADLKFGEGSLKKFEDYASSGNHVKSNASYSCFSIGDAIVEKIGLFDEYIYPAYFEDNDYDDRMVLAGLQEFMLNPGIHMEQLGGTPSQTIKSDAGLMSANNKTFNLNERYYKHKKETGDYSVKGWDLNRRRENEWLR
jgi:GT2 family glycosyltransferase